MHSCINFDISVMIDMESLIVIIVGSVRCRIDAGDFGLNVGECGGGVNRNFLKKWRNCWRFLEGQFGGFHH